MAPKKAHTVLLFGWPGPGATTSLVLWTSFRYSSVLGSWIAGAVIFHGSVGRTTTILGWWLSHPLKNIWVGHLGLLFAVYGKIKHLPNHQPVVGIWTFMRFGDFASSVGIYLDPKTGFVVDRTRGVTKKQPFHWSHQLHRVRITVDLLLELPESNAKCAELWYLPTNGGGNWRVFWIPNYGDIDHKKIH